VHRGSTVFSTVFRVVNRGGQFTYGGNSR
jgi:hypothetical protein